MVCIFFLSGKHNKGSNSRIYAVSDHMISGTLHIALAASGAGINIIYPTAQISTHTRVVVLHAGTPQRAPHGVETYRVYDSVHGTAMNSAYLASRSRRGTNLYSLCKAYGYNDRIACALRLPKACL
jgi:hypothetical protein